MPREDNLKLIVIAIERMVETHVEIEHRARRNMYDISDLSSAEELRHELLTAFAQADTVADQNKPSEPEPVVTLLKLPTETYGLIKVEECPEGLVFWVGDEIRWRSWPSNVELMAAVKLMRDLIILLRDDGRVIGGYRDTCNSTLAQVDRIITINKRY